MGGVRMMWIFCVILIKRKKVEGREDRVKARQRKKAEKGEGRHTVNLPELSKVVAAVVLLDPGVVEGGSMRCSRHSRM
eukprot:scaffold5090_cov109-Skeletonema_dohrnii-CCMP3373.AAC.4